MRINGERISLVTESKDQSTANHDERLYITPCFVLQESSMYQYL